MFQILAEELYNKTYHPKNVNTWIGILVETVLNELQKFNMDENNEPVHKYIGICIRD